MTKHNPRTFLHYKSLKNEIAICISNKGVFYFASWEWPKFQQSYSNSRNITLETSSLNFRRGVDEYGKYSLYCSFSSQFFNVFLATGSLSGFFSVSARVARSVSALGANLPLKNGQIGAKLSLAIFRAAPLHFPCFNPFLLTSFHIFLIL